LFGQLLREAWQAKSAHLNNQRAQIVRQIEDRETDLRKLQDKYLYQDAISKELFEEESVRLEKNIRDLRLELKTLDDWRRDDAGQLFRFAETLFSRTAELWESGDAEQRQRLHQVFFPEGLKYSSEGFRTACICDSFNYLPKLSNANGGAASPTGITPFT
jgi:hypothetical protein